MFFRNEDIKTLKEKIKILEEENKFLRTQQGLSKNEKFLFCGKPIEYWLKIEKSLIAIKYIIKAECEVECDFKWCKSTCKDEECTNLKILKNCEVLDESKRL